MEVVHATADLDRPIDENFRRYSSIARQDSVERTSDGVFHDETEFRRYKAHTAQHDDVGVVQRPEQLGFLHHILASDVVVELGVVSGFFDGDQFVSVEGSLDFTEAT